MSHEQTLAEVVQACRAKIAAREADDEAVAARVAAIRKLVHDEGVPARQAPAMLREALLDAGFTAGQIAGLGVSYMAVRKATEHVDSPPPPP